jgi:hypothetical protein
VVAVVLEVEEKAFPGKQYQLKRIVLHEVPTFLNLSDVVDSPTSYHGFVEEQGEALERKVRVLLLQALVPKPKW